MSINNPLTPVSKFSFWSATMRPFCNEKSGATAELIAAVDETFDCWVRKFNSRTELPLSHQPYLLDNRGVTRGAGLTQIRAYATENGDKQLSDNLAEVQRLLKALKTEFYEILSGSDGLCYFGAEKKPPVAVRTTSANSGSFQQPRS